MRSCRPRSLAHLSDLHIGRGRDSAERAAALCHTMLDNELDHVVLTGDITHAGRRDELELFQRVFAPLLEQGKLTLVPGNHDCLGDDVSVAMMPGARVQVTRAPGLYLVRFNSTGPQNRYWIASHGTLTVADVEQIADALQGAPADALVVLMLHHHVLPLPHDMALERLVARLGFSFTDELERGRSLIDLVRGHCDLVLHGHRHQPGRSTMFGDDARPLGVFNAGSSTGLGGVRVFTHAAGKLTGDPRWLAMREPLLADQPLFTWPGERLVTYG